MKKKITIDRNRCNSSRSIFFPKFLLNRKTIKRLILFQIYSCIFFFSFFSFFFSHISRLHLRYYCDKSPIHEGLDKYIAWTFPNLDLLRHFLIRSAKCDPNTRTRDKIVSFDGTLRSYLPDYRDVISVNRLLILVRRQQCEEMEKKGERKRERERERKREKDEKKGKKEREYI